MYTNIDVEVDVYYCRKPDEYVLIKVKISNMFELFLSYLIQTFFTRLHT